MVNIFNTGETQQSLRAEYNPEGSTLRRAQLRLLDMAVYIQAVAKQLNIPCRLDGGNVLGAVRHGGFIPWDDDIDVVVDYKDFKKLCDYLKSHPHPQFVLQDNSTDSGFYKAWACLRDLKSENKSVEEGDSKDRRIHEAQKFRGLHVDIFPYESNILPSLQKFSAKCLVNANKLFAGKHPFLAQLGYNFLMKGMFPCFRLLGRFIGRKDIMMHSYGAWFYEQIPTSISKPHKDIIFEGKTFEGPADPDALCRNIYKDYMNLPPKDKRNRHKIEVTFFE